jgi:hypothetical protein
LAGRLCGWEGESEEVKGRRGREGGGGEWRAREEEGEGGREESGRGKEGGGGE